MGLLDSAKQQAMVSVSHYHPGSRLPGTTAADYDIRDTSNHLFTIGLARDGVIDLGIALNHTLTAAGASVPVWVQVISIMDLSAVGGSANSTGITLFSSTDSIDDMPAQGRWWLLPEVSEAANSAVTTRLIGIPELRGPVDAIQVRARARIAPDAGTFNIRANRRY